MYDYAYDIFPPVHRGGVTNINAFVITVKIYFDEIRNTLSSITQWPWFIYFFVSLSRPFFQHLFFRRLKYPILNSVPILKF